MSVSETLGRADDEEGIDWALLVGSVLVCELAGIVPSILTADEVATWYPTLAKPAFTPPSWVFGPVWTTLYLLMGVALYLVWRSESEGEDVSGGESARESKSESRGESDRSRLRQVALGLFAVQLVLNAGWTLVFFGSQAIFGGLVVIVALLAALLATMAAFWRIDRRAALLLVPYLLWVGFATALNFELWRLNG